MGAILAIFGSVFSAIWGILAKLPWQLYVAIGLVLLGGWIFHGGSCRDFMCKRPVKPPRPPHSETFDVVSVPTGASIEVKLRGRRTAIIALQGIQAPNDGEPLAEQSRAHLERVAGSVGATVRIEWQRGGLLRGTPDEEPEAPEARPPTSGIAFSSSGACLNVEMLAAGLAKLLPDAPKAWAKAQAEAKKAKRGIWGATER